MSDPPQRLTMLPPSLYLNIAIHGNSDKSVLFPLESFDSMWLPQSFHFGKRYKFGCAEASSGKPSRLPICGSDSSVKSNDDVVGCVCVNVVSVGQHTVGVL